MNASLSAGLIQILNKLMPDQAEEYRQIGIVSYIMLYFFLVNPIHLVLRKPVGVRDVALYILS